jgi:hypothetical protein
MSALCQKRTRALQQISRRITHHHGTHVSGENAPREDDKVKAVAVLLCLNCLRKSVPYKR